MLKYKNKEYYSTLEISKMVDRTPHHIRTLLNPPDKISVSGGNRYNWYEKERVEKWLVNYEKIAKKNVHKKRRKNYTVKHILGDGKGVHTWCIKCGYPFTSQKGEKICPWCEKGVSRNPEDLRVLTPKKLRSTPCPDCGGPRFIGQILCSFCRKEKSYLFTSYDPWLNADVV